jgi:tetratricopeptide (TPR) repeat protein
MAAVAVGVGLFTPSRAVPFEKRDWILIADVENSTGDTLFDRSLDMALTIAIQQSQHVNVYPRPRVEETLRRMGRDSVDGLSEPLAREIAERENLPVVVVPSISRLDSVYLLGIRLVDPVTGVDLSSRSDRAIGANEVLSSLDRLARRLRRDLGESRRSLSRLGRQLPQVTTASLEALKAWAAGLQPGTSWEHAGRLWLRAIELDSNFAMAHNSLGLFYYWAQSDRLRGDKHFEKALSLSDRVTERERMLIQANAASWRGNREEAVEVYEIYLRQYPDDATTWHDLGYSRMMLGRSAEALDAFANVLELDSSSSDAYINIATIHAAEGRMAEAVPYYLRAFELQPDYRLVANINHEFGFNYAELGDFEAAEDVFNLAISDPRGDRARGLRSLALLRMFVGKYAEAAQFLEQSIVLNQTTAPGVSEMRDRLFLVMALSTAGATEALKRALEDAYARFRAVYLPPEWLQDWGMLFARNGYLERAEEVVDSAEARADPDNRDDVVALHLLRGEVALARGAYEEATDHFERARALEARTTRHQERLARSYLLKGDLDRAREWYEQILAVRSLGHEGQETWVLAHYQLGRIFEEQGDTTNALDCYGRLLGIWEEADSDIPLLLDTRRRVTQLQLPR